MLCFEGVLAFWNRSATGHPYGPAVFHCVSFQKQKPKNYRSSGAKKTEVAPKRSGFTPNAAVLYAAHTSVHSLCRSALQWRFRRATRSENAVSAQPEHRFLGMSPTRGSAKSRSQPKIRSHAMHHLAECFRNKKEAEKVLQLGVTEPPREARRPHGQGDFQESCKAHVPAVSSSPIENRVKMTPFST